MARPTKQGISYFPVDVEWDEKIEMFAIENEAEGIGILVTLWQLIYKNEGYYIESGNDLFLMLKKRTGKEVNVCKNVVNACINRNIFNKQLFDRHNILTSRAIQKRYFDIAKRKKVVNVYKNYICIGINEYTNLVYVDNNATKEEVKEEGEVNVNVNEEEEEYIIVRNEIKKPEKKAKTKYVQDNPPTLDEVETEMLIWTQNKELLNKLFTMEEVEDIAESFYDHYSSPECNWTFMAGGTKRTKLQKWRNKTTEWMKRRRDDKMKMGRK